MGNDAPRWRFSVGFVLGVLVGSAITFLALAAGLLDPRPPVVPPKPTAEWGEFVQAPPRVELLEDGRSLRLTADFVYIDPRKKVWVAKKDAVVNGASIPKVFWSITGGPLEGRYRDASIIHDEGCREMMEPSADVHLAFYEACRCSGVPERQAKMLYAAVYHFGPTWEVERVFETRESVDKKGRKVRLRIGRRVPRIAREAAEPDESVPQKLEAYVDSKNPSLEELRQIDPRAL